jgi:hypothetical protein
MNNPIEEIWKPIEGFKIYQISNFGRVKSLERYTHIGTRGGFKYRPEFIMKGCDFGYQYLKVNLKDNSGKIKNVKVHRLVAQHFIPNPHNKRCVNHKDFNRCNNHVDNLEWVTHLENSEHMIQGGRHSNGRGKNKKTINNA